MHSIALLVIQRDDGKFLLMFRDGNAPTFPLHWGCFGGHLDPGESPIDCARREMLEETGIDAKSEDFSLLGTFEATDRIVHAVRYVPRISGEIRLGEGAGYAFFTVDELKKLTPFAESASAVFSKYVYSKG